MGWGKKIGNKIRNGAGDLRDKAGDATDKVKDRAAEAARKAREIAEREAREAKERAEKERKRIEREAREAAAKLKRQQERLAQEALEAADRLKREKEKAKRDAKRTAEMLERKAREKARKEAERLEREARERAAQAKAAALRAKKLAEEKAAAVLEAGEATLRRLDVQTWPTNADRFDFPEKGDRQLEKRENLGLAVSGGGTRSMSLALGYMRALSEQGVLSKVRYIGAISGGSWISTPYCYLPSGISDTEFLGVDTPARNLTADRLSELVEQDGLMAPRIAGSDLVFPLLAGLAANSLARTLSLPRVPFSNLRFGLDDVDEEWGRALGGLFLQPFKAHGDRYAAWRDEDAQRIIQRNTNILGNHKLDAGDFVVQQPDRPFLCVNGAMNQDAYLIRDDRDEKWRPLGWRSWEHVEFTPLYSGIHRHSRGKAKLNVGGGYVENVGMDTVFPVAKGGFVNVSTGINHHRFSPQDMMAISGAAPAYITHGIGSILRSLPTNPVSQLINVMPKLRDWPVQFLGKPAAIERCYGDGGYVDNHGIIPLLKRKVDKIIVLINTDVPLGQHETRVLGKKPECDTFLHTLFGENTGPSLSALTPSDFLQPGRFLGRENGQVFEKSGLRPLLKGMLDNRNAGHPAFFRGTFTTLDNEFFGIEGGHSCEILWIYNDLFEAWFDQLPDDTKRLFKGRDNARPGLEYFPHLSTAATGAGRGKHGLDKTMAQAWNEEGVKGVIDNLDSVVDLDPYQVKLAASHSYTIATALKDEIAELVGG